MEIAIIILLCYSIVVTYNRYRIHKELADLQRERQTTILVVGKLLLHGWTLMNINTYWENSLWINPNTGRAHYITDAYEIASKPQEIDEFPDIIQ